MTELHVLRTTVLATLLAGGPMTMPGEGARLEKLEQPPLNTTMMGVLKGVADYHGLNLETPMIYGLSGHAFLINIHTQLCPSGPYCWKRETAKPLIENMGLRMNDLGFFGTGAKEEARAEVERKLREALDKGIPCSLLNLENQIVSGYDATGFSAAQPWAPKNKFPPGKLTFGTWEELGKEFHISFYTFEKVQPAELQLAILASLDYAIDMWRNPAAYSTQAYGAGPDAYDNWIRAVPADGSGHGNWWNATVWSECRQMAAAYFADVAKTGLADSALCAQLQGDYLKIAANLKKASDKKMDTEEKVALLKATRQLEAEAIGKVEMLAKAIRAKPKS